MSASDVASQGAMAAIFYVSGGPAWFTADETDPTRDGLPIYPGGHIIQVGRKNIADAKWSNMDPGKAAMITVLYYDQVDIIAADMGVIPANQPKDTTSVLSEILKEMRVMRAMTEFNTGLDSRDFKVG